MPDDCDQVIDDGNEVPGPLISGVMMGNGDGEVRVRSAIQCDNQTDDGSVGCDEVIESVSLLSIQNRTQTNAMPNRRKCFEETIRG